VNVAVIRTMQVKTKLTMSFPKTTFLSFAAGAAVLFLICTSTPLFGQDELSVSISTPVAVPSDGRTRTLPMGDDTHFHVVISNNTNTQQKIWQSWNSWGFYNLRFDILNDKNEVIHSVVKNPNRVWTVNYPSQTTIRPKQHFVMDIDLSHKDWVVDRGDKNYQRFSTFLKTRERYNLNIRMVYENRKDDEAEKLSTWTGVAKTNAETFLFQPIK